MKNEDKILVIDDEEIVLDSCIEILATGNYKIATATNGKMGLNLVKEFQPDLIFLDLKMPGLSGFKVLENICEMDNTIVTIVITGYATVNSAIEAMKKGAYDFLPKPFTPEELRLITRRGMEKRKLLLSTIALRREKEMLRENFATIVSHELKSPLNAVQQNLFALASDLVDTITDEQKNQLERMKVRISDLLKLIHTWLRVISVDVEKIKESFTELPTKTVVTKAVESAQPQAIRKDVSIIFSGREMPSTIYGDEVTLVEALTNILNNAVKFSRVGSKIFVKTEVENDKIKILVQDTGVGISKEDLPYIFGDFYVGKSVQKEERGSGIGLAMSKRIIDAHNGSISVESDLEKGSTFIIRLPIIIRNSQYHSAPKSDLHSNSQKGVGQ